MARPDNDTSINLANCVVNGWAPLSNVQYRLSKKLLVTAKQKPSELDRYLLKPSFSLQTQVTEKSIAIPLKPTSPNLNKRLSSALIMQFV